MSIKHIRLVNGEEILGILVEETDTHFMIDKPLMIDEVLSEDGVSTILLVQYMPFSTNTVCIFNKDHVITATDLHSVMERYYNLSLQVTSKNTQRMIGMIDKVNRAIEHKLSEQASESRSSNTIH